jgi:hypothetical protein
MPANEIAAANPDYFLDSAGGAFIAGKTMSTFADVRRILDKAVAAQAESGLVIHFHGGLVSRDAALGDIVPRLTQDYLHNAKGYPLFFVWQSGFIETLVNNKNELLKDPTFRQLMMKVTELVVKKITKGNGIGFRGENGAAIQDLDNYRKQFDEWFDGRRSAPPQAAEDGKKDDLRTRAGNVDEYELEAEVADSINADPGFQKAFEEAYNGIAAAPGPHTTERSIKPGSARRAGKVLLSDAAIDEMFSQPLQGAAGTKKRGVFELYKIAKFTAKIILAVLKRYSGGRDHGLYCSVVEEVLRSAYLDYVGANIWNQMKNDTLDSFDTERRVGAAVVGALKAVEGQGLDKVTLVGHSTGAIYICNFLDAAKKAGLDTTQWQVVFLAPAITCQRFALAIKEHGDTALKRFRMFAMKDELESADVLVPILYTRSLLYFVSGLLEGVPKGPGWDSIVDMPIVGMQRFVDGNARFQDDQSVQTVMNFLRAAEFPHRVVWSAVTLPDGGLSSNASTHGAFDDEATTVASVCHFIANREA